MKWIALVPMTVALAACGYTNTEVVEYKQVSVTPVVTTTTVTPVVTKTIVTRPIVNTAVVTKPCCASYVRTPCCTSVVRRSCCASTIETPVVTTPIYDSTTIIDTEPVDVTTTAVEYY